MKHKEETPGANPYIEQVLGTTGDNQAKPITSAKSSEVIQISGGSYGNNSSDVFALFDDYKVPVFPVPFSQGELFVTCPLPDVDTKTLCVQVKKKFSKPKEFRVTRPSKSKDLAGSHTIRYFQAIDHVAALTVGFAHQLAPYSEYRSELSNAAKNLDNSRIVLQNTIELLMQWGPLQKGINFEPIRTIEVMDNMIMQSKLTEGIENLTNDLYGNSSPLMSYFKASKSSTDFFYGKSNHVEAIFSSVASGNSQAKSSLGGILDWGGFIIHELSKLMESGENIAKLMKPSVAVGASLGVEGDVDVEFDWGEAISAVAKLVDVIAQIMQKWGGSISSAEAGKKIAKLEAKADRQHADIININNFVTKIDKNINKLEGKADKAENILGKLESKAYKTEGKLDKLEGKADRAEGKLDKLDEKNDRLEAKGNLIIEILGMIETKNDKMEGKLDLLEGKADKAESKLDKLEGKADRAESKLDKLEGKADRAEGKLDKLEGKADRAEGKLDKLEGKADRAESKLDKLEGKADRAEGKLDKLEGKTDKLEVKLDSWKVPVSQEGSIANQRGGSDHVTAGVAAIKMTPSEVFIRFAIDIRRNRVDKLNNWTPWIPFGRPSNVVEMVGVSLDLQYEEGSDSQLNAILSVRARTGKVYLRSFHNHEVKIKDPVEWDKWNDLLGQP